MQQETYDALTGLFKKKPDWSEELVSGEGLKWIYEKVLSPVEREIVNLKVEGDVDGEVAIKLGVKLETVKRAMYDIKYKYRNGMGRRIDNHPIFRKQKGFIVRRRRTK